jgi:hypothetical protein
MSSTSGVGPSPAPTTPPAPQNTPQPAKSTNDAAAASKPDDTNSQGTNTVQPTKPPGQGQVVYISV